MHVFYRHSRLKVKAYLFGLWFYNQYNMGYIHFTDYTTMFQCKCIFHHGLLVILILVPLIELLVINLWIDE